jgi:hypothetical protein
MFLCSTGEFTVSNKGESRRVAATGRGSVRDSERIRLAIVGKIREVGAGDKDRPGFPQE